MELSQVAILAAVGFFFAFLLFQFRPSARRARREVGLAIRDARARAYKAKTPEERADALSDAGEAAVKANRWAAATGYFLRAMRGSPASASIVSRAGAGLARRPLVSERTFWRRLAALPDDDTHRAAYIETVRQLASLYESSLPDKGRARALRRLETLEAMRDTAELISGSRVRP